MWGPRIGGSLVGRVSCYDSRPKSIAVYHKIPNGKRILFVYKNIEWVTQRRDDGEKKELVCLAVGNGQWNMPRCMSTRYSSDGASKGNKVNTPVIKEATSYKSV